MWAFVLDKRSVSLRVSWGRKVPGCNESALKKTPGGGVPSAGNLLCQRIPRERHSTRGKAPSKKNLVSIGYRAMTAGILECYLGNADPQNTVYFRHWEKLNVTIAPWDWGPCRGMYVRNGGVKFGPVAALPRVIPHPSPSGDGTEDTSGLVPPIFTSNHIGLVHHF